MAFQIYKCPGCSATLAPETTRCGYCGAEVRFVQEGATPAGPVQAEWAAAIALANYRAEAAATADSPHAWVNQARAEAKGGNKISAIKLVREHTGWGLRDAKDFVERGALEDPAELAKLGPSKAGEKRASCFPAETRVATPTGWRPIGSLRRGERVLSWSPEGLTVQPITRVVTYAQAPLWRLVLERPITGARKSDYGRPYSQVRQIITTSHHNLLSARGWVRAGRLHAGDELCGADDQRSRVLATGPTGESAPVYNLRTAGPHTFIVEGAIAHNFTTLRGLRTWWHQLIDFRARSRRLTDGVIA